MAICGSSQRGSGKGAHEFGEMEYVAAGPSWSEAVKNSNTGVLEWVWLFARSVPPMLGMMLRCSACIMVSEDQHIDAQSMLVIV